MKGSKRSKRRTPAFLEDLVVEPGASMRRPQLPAALPLAKPVGSSPSIEDPHDQALLERLMASTPSKVGIGRTGTRYRTSTYIDLRGEHAIAKDAVYADLAENMAAQLGCIEVRSRCEGREHYLLNPNEGRRLSDESRTLLSSAGDRGTDVQLILADGLAAPATELNGPELLKTLLEELKSRRLTIGKPILARMARVGLQDDIGVLLDSRATAICLGERPGLGTGDSLSIYIAIAPKLDQDNAEKNCISNVRPLGLSPVSAAKSAADLIERGLAAGQGGLGLT